MSAPCPKEIDSPSLLKRAIAGFYILRFLAIISNSIFFFISPLIC